MGRCGGDTPVRTRQEGEEPGLFISKQTEGRCRRSSKRRKEKHGERVSGQTSNWELQLLQVALQSVWEGVGVM